MRNEHEEFKDRKKEVVEQVIGKMARDIDELRDKVETIHQTIFATPEVLIAPRDKVEEVSPEVYLAPGGRIEEIKRIPSQRSRVKDPSLAKQGKLKIEWAEKHMPVLMKIRERFEREKPLKGLVVAACLHVTKESAGIAKTLQAGGATVALCGSNPLSTQDDVAAALAEEGINVFAWRGVTNEEYYWCIDQVLNFNPNITIDDGADVISIIHSKRPELIKDIIGGQEETTTGVIRLRSMAKDGALKYPLYAVNDTPTKRMFDNVYGTGQSTIDGILRATNILISGSTFVVVGYGYCSTGVAKRAVGMGANVVVVEVDPIKALQATMDGYRVMPMIEAAKIGDIFVTATGDKGLIRKEHFELMKDGAILANSGHFNIEININDLESLSKNKRVIRENVEEYELMDGRIIYLLAEGRLVNLSAAEGHPSEVMDMSFANQALIAEHLVKNRGSFENKVYDVPKEIDDYVARLKLETLGINIDKLTDEQEKYLSSWEEGT